MSKRQITIKPTCMRELTAFPLERSAALWEKINWLVSDPFPDGKVKKKLRGGDGIYRLRVGNYRVFYRFGEDWVSLLGVRRRREDTYRAMPEAESTPVVAPDFDDDLDELLEPTAPPQFQFEPEQASAKALPVALTKDWLKDHGVPASAFPFLLRVKTEEDLLEAPIPGDVMASVLDAIFPPSLDAVARQPDLVVPSTEHLVRYKEGDLLGFLLRLDEEQVRLTRWAMKGPTMVRGGAGTGKSTVALYRVKEVLERSGATGTETVLFTTYTRALITVTRQLLEQILTPAQLARVRIATVDQIAWEIVASRRSVGRLEGDYDALKRLRTLKDSFQPATKSAFQAKLQKRAVDRLSDRYLLEEFDWIIDGRELATLEAYKAAPRPGRGVAFSERLRENVWQLHGQFVDGASGERFPALRNEALSIVREGYWSGHFDYVFVDEAQDLSPAALGLMAEVASTAEGLFFAADSKQSLYSRNYTWSSVHPRLQFRGRTAILRRNYRSTREIDRAAFALLRAEEGETLDESTSIHDGPLPVLVRGVEPDAEPAWIARFIRQMSRHLHLRSSAAAVLVPSGPVGQALAEALCDAGLPATYFAGRDLDLGADTVKVVTLYSAKGLEFPIVVAAGFEEGTYPVADDFDDPELFAERMRHERRLLYVGLTRAMRGLMVVVPKGCSHEALVELDAGDWHIEEAP
ncbi:MAG: UvrD-helicase domain-containing protein [Alphaproteobacteria bacterium]|nr:UvrD-helicase domain-containing protein [Alphaproteobacteria bacterium]